MSLWDEFGKTFQGGAINRKMRALRTFAPEAPAPQDGNALLSTLDLRNVRPWSEGRYSPRRAQKPPGPRATAAPEAAKSGNALTVKAEGAPSLAGEAQAPAPVSMRWILTPCLLVPIALELDASGALTWQAGQFDEHVRALCSEHGPRIRVFLSTLPGHRWESWQENALEAADRWEAGQGARQKGQWHD